MYDTLWINAHLATMTGDSPYGAIHDGAIAAKDGRIAWIGPQSGLPDAPDKLAKNVMSLDGRWVTPGLIDCHTHLVFGGNRAEEFEMRLQGATYEEIAKAGGGIVSTVKATRVASKAELVNSAQPRLGSLMSEGVTTVEIKSGYGLTTADEIKMLEAAAALVQHHPVRVQKTFLGAHALPPEYKDNRGGYIDLVCNEMIPEIAKRGLADAVDAFCEGIGFTTEEVRRVFEAAKAYNLPIKLHAEQLSDLGGAVMAAEMGALSADHLEYLKPEDVPAFAKSGAVAVLLPGAFYFLKETKKPPIDVLRKAGVPMALATDCNPGSSPITSPLAIMNMGCTLFDLTPEEALAGFTRNAAKALGLGNEIGQLNTGMAADFAIWNINHPAELSYWLGAELLHNRVFGGELD